MMPPEEIPHIKGTVLTREYTYSPEDPNHQEYPSAHATVSGGALRMMANLFGNDHTFVLSSPGYPSFTITYTSFSAAATGVQNARIWGGLHYRFSCDVGLRDGIAIADYIYANFMRLRADQGLGN